MIRPILYIIIIVISLGFSILNVVPAYFRVQAAQGFLVSLSDVTNGTERIKSLMDQTGKELSKVDPINLERFNVFLPETIDEIRFINNLSHIGILNGIILEDISVDKGGNNQPSAQGESLKKNTVYSSLAAGSPEKKYITTRVRFSLSAPYATALAFFDDLEKSLGLINITALSFSPQGQGIGGKEGTGPTSYRYTLELETYSLHPPAQVGSPEANSSLIKK